LKAGSSSKYPEKRKLFLSLSLSLYLSTVAARAGGCVSSCTKSNFTTVCKYMSLSFFLFLDNAHREQQRRLLLLLLLLLLPLRRERGGETFSISGAFA
jgi:hypothetical protein